MVVSFTKLKGLLKMVYYKFVKEDTHTYIYGQQDDLISLLLLFENKESRLKNFCSQTKQHILTLINIITLKEIRKNKTCCLGSKFDIRSCDEMQIFYPDLQAADNN
jgi:hypothetical protein